MMKKLAQLTLLVVIALTVSANAEIYFSDNYTVTGSGDADYQYADGVRQSGSLSPTNYVDPTIAAVSDSGDYAGLCHMTESTGISPNEMYTNNSGKLIYEFDIIRYNTDWTAFAFGKDDELRLYFSEATGAGENGKIYKIEDGKASNTKHII